ncbi:3-hydroxyacyl-CoA dehydrogenase NAD-binding domain-containing protein [Propionibacteriaceae bacterium Y2011]|uniref:3-hydroxyacyl-CoA dehydrogenase NAD-binding domain-containing protein n=1 Tax=Microlunatus sp. Y2014 TaxID=3418488 RepID=UPI003B44DD8A
MSIATGSELDDLISRASALTDDEVVTNALARDITLPHGAGTLVLITLDNGLDHKRPNTFGPRSLGKLNETLDGVLARDDIAGIAITGKPYILAAGADLSGVAKIKNVDDARAIARIGHGVFDRLRTAKVPTFAFINGLALGGGLEVNLNCHYRTINSAAPAIALPECFLGLVPGWGGAYLVPNLIGAEKALKLIIENPLNQNRMLKGFQAYELGLADVMFDAADFLERSIDWAAKVITGDVTVERPEVDRGDAWDNAVAGARALVDQKLSGAAPAPYRALDLVAAAKTATAEEAFDAEDAALSELIMSEELRAGLYAFDLVQKRAKRPAGAPDKELARPVTKVGIVGAGLMAAQLALLFVRRLEVPVVISDLDQERVDRGVAGVHAELDKLAGKGRLSPDSLNRYKALLSGTTDQQDFADCDFVIEAVFEEMKVKQEVFGGLEKIVSPECVLATNTSSLSITEIASTLQHPERVVGFHFFNPVAVLPLLEIIRGEKTDDATLATAFATSKNLKKNSVLVADAPGFVVNRILIRLMCEIWACVDEGTPVEVADQAFRSLGLPMSPFVLLQLVGPAIALHVAETLHGAFGDRFHVSPNLKALVEAGKPGIYDWTAEGKPYVSDETQALFTVGDKPSTGEQVFDRATAALADEIFLMLSQGVVEAPMDIDLCLVLGAGWPFHLGGITPYLDRSGVSEKVNDRRFLPKGVATLP